MKAMTWGQSEIKLDIDSSDQPNEKEILRLLHRAGYEVVSIGASPSPSGNGWHVRLFVSPRPQSPYEVVALQLLLGSDPNREAMQMHRARSFFDCPGWMRNMWNVLYLPHPQRVRRLTLENK